MAGRLSAVAPGRSVTAVAFGLSTVMKGAVSVVFSAVILLLPVSVAPVACVLLFIDGGVLCDLLMLVALAVTAVSVLRPIGLIAALTVVAVVFMVFAVSSVLRAASCSVACGGFV